MAWADARSAAIHQLINDIEYNFGNRLGFTRAFSEVLFLGIIYQPGKFVPFVPVHVQMNRKSRFLALLLCFPANLLCLHGICSVPSWKGSHGHHAILDWSMLVD